MRTHHVGVVHQNLGRRKHLDNTVIKLVTAVLFQLLDNDAQWKRLAIRSIRKHRIDSIAHDYNLCADRNFISDQPVWIALSVLPLVVVPDSSDNLLWHRRKVAQELFTPCDVRLDDRSFLRRQGVRLPEDLRVDGLDLPDIVEQSGLAHVFHTEPTKTHRLCDLLCQLRYAQRMSGRIGVPGFDGLDQRSEQVRV